MDLHTTGALHSPPRLWLFHIHNLLRLETKTIIATFLHAFPINLVLQCIGRVKTEHHDWSAPALW
jgi:hypothetical protein